MSRRGKRPALTTLACAAFVLAQATGCGACVKDDPQPSSVSVGNRPATERKAVAIRAVDRDLTKFGLADAGVPNDLDASSSPPP